MSRFKIQYPSALALLFGFCFSLSGLIPGGAARAGELVMYEQKLCEWCEEWHTAIGQIYPKTPEGKRAPLRLVDIHDPKPADLAHIDSGRFTPTFVLVQDGVEYGRIRGYPGEDFFWSMLGEMMAKLPDTKGTVSPIPLTRASTFK